MAIQLARHSWVAGLLVPVLPDPAGDEEVEADLRRAYRTLAEAVARVGVGDCAVQVRPSSWIRLALPVSRTRVRPSTSGLSTLSVVMIDDPVPKLSDVRRENDSARE